MGRDRGKREQKKRKKIGKGESKERERKEKEIYEGTTKERQKKEKKNERRQRERIEICYRVS